MTVIYQSELNETLPLILKRFFGLSSQVFKEELLKIYRRALP